MLKEKLTNEAIGQLTSKGLFISGYRKIEELAEKIITLIPNLKKESIKLLQFTSSLEILKNYFRENLQTYTSSQKFPNSENITSLKSKRNIFKLDRHEMLVRELQGNIILVDCLDIFDYKVDATKTGKCNWCEEEANLINTCACKEV